MPFQVKHYIAIGVGAGIALVYGMHLSSRPDSTVAFNPPSSALHALSGYGNGTERELRSNTVEVDRFTSLKAANPTQRQPDVAERQLSENVRWNSQWDLASATKTQDRPLQIEASRDLDLGPTRDDLVPGTPSVALHAPDRVTAYSSQANAEDFEFDSPEIPRPEPNAGIPVLELARTKSIERPDIAFRQGTEWESSAVKAAAISTAPEFVVPVIATEPIAESVGAVTESISELAPVNSNMAINDQDRRLAVMVEPFSPLPLVESAAIQAAHHIEYGKSLSRRGSSFAARQEFFSALQVIAEANDERMGGSNHTGALRLAMLELTEATDFKTGDANNQISMTVANVVQSHLSNVLTPNQIRSMTPNQAMQQYLLAAGHHLDIAGGRNVVTAEALFCLGKLYTSISKNESKPGSLDVEKSIAFHQASLLSDKNNFRSANELGVLMAQTGQLRQAKQLFQRSLIVRQTPQTWSNLATAHRRLGEGFRAKQAENEVIRLAQTKSSGNDAPIRWLRGNEFNAAAPQEIQHRTASRSGLETKQHGSQKSNTARSLPVGDSTRRF